LRVDRPESPFAFLIGSWAGNEELFATPWAAGGVAHGRWSFRFDSGGRHLIHDYAATRDDGSRFDAHGVLAPDERGNLLWFWFDSYGYVPVSPGTGEWNGQALVLTRTSPRGSNRTILTPAPNGGFGCDITFTASGEAKPMPVARGIYHRQA
jgi:hypothetical protein